VFDEAGDETGTVAAERMLSQCAIVPSLNTATTLLDTAPAANGPSTDSTPRAGRTMLTGEDRSAGWTDVEALKAVKTHWSAAIRRPQALLMALCWMAICGAHLASPAHAQLSPGGGGIPSPVYFNALPLYFDGDYRDAAGAFSNAARSGIKTGAASSSWIDGICYYTMAGESYYQLGQMRAALDSYNAALKIYITYSDWMLRVQFPPAIGPASNSVQATPWGQSKRGTRAGAFSETYMMSQGQVDNSAVVMRGGVVQNPVMFAVHAIEILRCTSLAIRRRHELLGPVCKHDPLTSDIIDVLARRPGPPNHWTEAWINVELGCAYFAAGNPQAAATLQNGLLVQGEYDHPLTSTALVVLGRMALESGDFATAGRHFEEATYACANFPNPGVLEEAFRLGLEAHLLSNQKAPYPILSPAIAWGKSQANRQLQSSLLLCGAENMAVLGETDEAGGLLNAARALIGRTDLNISQTAARLNYLTGLVACQSGNVTAGDQAIGAALAFQRGGGSVWNFQLATADERYMHGDLTDRVGMILYDALLRDPSPNDWRTNPLECLSILTTPHEAALEHWFEAAAKNSKEQELAVEIADRARRHRFYSTLPLGGRLLALRWILEGPVELLGEQGLLQRQDLLTRFPKYAALAKDAQTLREKLAAKPVVDDAIEARKEQAGWLNALAEISDAQEKILREISLSREPAEMVFPPQRLTKDVQAALPEGQVLLSFFATSENIYGFLYSREKYVTWQVHSPVALQKQLTNMLREMGNYDSNHELTHNELTKGAWRTSATKVAKFLFERSSVDLAGDYEELVIVPDGLLWYLPFEALNVGKPGHERPLISHARVRYAPTVGLAVPYGRANKPHARTGVVLGKLHPQDEDGTSPEAFEQISRAVTGAVALPRNLPAASSVYRVLLDGLIVLDDIEPTGGPYDWSPSQLDRNKGGALASWFSLPWGGPDNLILPGFHSAAETGMRKGHAAGNDLFLAVCGLMSAGSRTILISRWRPGGQTSFDLVREFAQELPHVSPAEAWQRSVRIATDTAIEPDHEPRVKKGAAGEEPFKADHPFFWAGYMLVDSGVLAPGSAAPAVGGGGADRAKRGIPANTPPGANPPQAANPRAPGAAQRVLGGTPQANGAAGGVPMTGDDAADSVPSSKGKKAKAPPRPAPKKPAPRKASKSADENS